MAANLAHPPASRKRAPRANARSAAPRSGVRERAAQATREGILRAAIKVFSTHGYAGGSVQKISKAAKSVDRMIYYYFGSKEGLFIAVIEAIYARMNEAEAELALDPAQPRAALLAFVRFVVGYYREHPEFITLLNTENLLRGRHIAKSMRAREYSSPGIAVVDGLLAAGAAQGVFRSDLAARDLYLLIASMGYFYQSNRHTLSAFLGEPLGSAEAQAHWEAFVADTVLRAVAPA